MPEFWRASSFIPQSYPQNILALRAEKARTTHGRFLMNAWREIGNHIAAVIGRDFVCHEPQSVRGGSINAAHVVHDGAQRFFVKTNRAVHAEMFAAEAEGLMEISKTRVLRVPEPICWGRAADIAYLVLEHIEFGENSEHASLALGTQLAQLHRVTTADFGWRRDNTIGTTPQRNTCENSWPVFWREHRVGFQLQLLISNGHHGQLITKLEHVVEAVPILLAGHTPQPALLHGDLWGGNFAIDTAGRPVIFDPATYYGDRETDLAMTELFGGFSPRFYHAYKNAYPLAAGYGVRKTLYNLYHVLNHVNLFGGGYASQAERMAGELLSELR